MTLSVAGAVILLAVYIPDLFAMSAGMFRCAEQLEAAVLHSLGELVVKNLKI